MSPRSLAPFAAAALALPLAAQGFVERSAELGIVHEFATGFDRVASTQLFDWTQRGMALGDIDGDGDVDILACGGVLTNTLLRNDGGVFVDVTAQSGLEIGDLDTAPAFADFDRDGDLDVYVAVMTSGGSGGPGKGRGRLYRNDGGGAFTEVSTLGAVPGSGHSLFAQWADLDADGLLDLLVSEFYATKNHFYRNNGDGTFSDGGSDVGLDAGGSTHVTAVLDVDGDGRLDVLVGNDYLVSKFPPLPDNLGDRHLQGQADGTWLDVSAGSAFDVERAIMGYALGDVDYDGDLDVYRTDVEANRMVINRGWPSGEPWLAEEQDAYGIAAAEVPWPGSPTGFGRAVGWGAVFLDVDLDLWLDLFLVNGQVGGFNPTNPYSPRHQPNLLWTGDGPGAGFAFTDRTAALGPFGEIDDRTVAAGDLDADGDLDLLVGPTTGFLRYYENQVDRAGQGWLAVEPICNTSGPGGFGVLARFTDSLGYPHVRQIGLDGPTASQHQNLATFGLGYEPSVDLEVEFPSGIVLAFPGATPNQTLQAVEPELIRLSERTLPIAKTSAHLAVKRLPTSAAVDGLYTVAAFAHAQDGTPLDGTAVVKIDTPGLVPLTAVVHVGGNEFRRTYLRPPVPGAYRTTVRFDGWTVGIRPRVHFFDPVDTSGTSVQLIPDAVRAGSTDAFDVIVAPKDVRGISLGAGKLALVQVAGTTVPLVDQGDGSYRATLSAPAAPGSYPVLVTVDGVALAGPAHVLEAAGTAVGSKTLVEMMQPSQVHAAAPHQLKVMLTLRDAAGLRLGPQADLQIVATPDAGSAPVALRTDLFPAGIRTGERMFVVEKPLTDPPTPASGVLQLFSAGLLLGQVTYSY